jgi:hypothetical protein
MVGHSGKKPLNDTATTPLWAFEGTTSSFGGDPSRLAARIAMVTGILASRVRRSEWKLDGDSGAI